MQSGRPRPEDGAKVSDLIARCKPLDENSLYCNLLQCSHFAQTCALAEQDGQPIAFVSGYLRPDAPDTLFIWQVAVAPEARGQGLASRLILEIVARNADKGLHHVHATITDDNAASWALFEGLADRLNTRFERVPGFDEQAHFDGRHATETLISIGPLTAQAARTALAPHHN